FSGENRHAHHSQRRTCRRSNNRRLRRRVRLSGRLKGLSVLRGNSHGAFLGEGVTAMSSSYPTLQLLRLQRMENSVGLGRSRPPPQPALRETTQTQVEAQTIVAKKFERRTGAIMEWKDGALRHCCRTFPPSPPHTGRARFRAPGVPNSILPGFSWSVISLMGLKVACLAKSNCRLVLGLIGLYSRNQ